MGVQASKELAEELNRAAAEANTSETTRVDHLLFSNPNFVSRLSTIWKELPKESRAEIQSRSRHDASKAPAADPSSSHRASKYFARLRGDITPSPYVKNFFETLKTNPLAVLNEAPEKSSKTQLSSQNNPLLELFVFGFLLEERNEVLKIQWRFLTAAFYLCRDRYEGHKLRSHTLINDIARSHPTGLSSSEALQTIQNWINVGARYYVFVRKLGPGCLFLFPDEIPRTALEKDLPKKGALHEEAMECLKKHGIITAAQKMDADRVAQNVLESLKNILDTCAPTTEVTVNRYQGRERLNLLASAAEAQNGGRDPTTRQYERFNNNPSKLFYRNEDQGEISATQPFTRQNCNLSVSGFSPSHQDFNGIVAQQQSDQEMGGFNAETDLQNLNQGIMGQQQLNPEIDVAINLELQQCDQSIVGQQQSDQEIGDFSAASDLDLQFNQAQQPMNHQMGGFNAERDLDPQQFSQAQQQVNHQMGGFNAERDLDPQQFSQAQQQVNHQMGGFNAERDLDPQQFNQGQQQLNHPMSPFNVEMAFNQSTMGEQQPNQEIEDFSAASDLDLQAQQQMSHQMGGFNAERDLDPQQFNQAQRQVNHQMGGFNAERDLNPQQFNQAQQQLNREMRKFDFNSTLPIVYG